MNFDKRLMRLLLKSRSLFFTSISLSLTSAGCVIGLAYCLSGFVNSIFLQDKELNELWSVVIGFFLFAALRVILSCIAHFFSANLAYRSKTEIRELLVNHIDTLGPIESRSLKTGNIVAMVTKGIDSLDVYFRDYIPQVILSLAIPYMIIAFIFPVSFTAGITMFLTVPLIPFFMFLIGSLAKSKSEEQWKTLKFLSTRFLDLLQGLVTLKFLGKSKEQAESLQKSCEAFRESTMGVLKVAFLSALVLELLSTLSVAVIAVSIGIKLMYGDIEFEQAFFILILAPEVYMPLRALGSKFHAGMDGVVAANNIYSVLETVVDSSSEEISASCTFDESKAIEFKNVSLTYNNSGRTALRDVSFSIEKNHKVAIVGETGAGKTSIFNLLLGFAQCTKGAISVAGKDCAAEGRKSLDYLGWLSQKPYIFNASVSDNIKIGNQNATQGEITEAGKLAHIHEFILTLPNGYDTVVGENGEMLSGGQVKRLAIARLFLKHASVVLIDEGTSDLDKKTESLIMESLDKLKEKSTVLIIAHRLSTIENSDEIIVMKDGGIDSIGTYESLISERGYFSELIKAGVGG